MAGLTDNFFLDPLLSQPFLRAEREDNHDKLFAPVAVAPSELDISPFGSVVVLCLVKSKGDRPLLASKRGVQLASRTPPPCEPALVP
jgi:hypothetical protein